MKLQTWIILACSVAIVALAIINKTKIKLNDFKLAFLLGAGYLFYVAYIPLTGSENLSLLFHILEQKASFLLLPFIILFLSKLTTIDTKRFFILFPIGAAVLSLSTHLYMMLNTQESTWMNHVNYRIAFESISGIHPSYFGMYCAFGLAICWFQERSNNVERILNYVLQIILLISLFLLTPKSAIISLGIIFILKLFLLEKNWNWKTILKPILISVAAILLFLLVPFFHQRIQEVILFISGNKHDLINNSMDMRNLIFNIDLALLKQHWLVGIGPIQLQQELNLLLQLSTSFTGQPVQPYNTHNEYLNQWLCFGIGGFVYFISIIGIHIRRSITTHNHLYLFLMIILVISFFTENLLSRQHGILFYSLFSSLFFFSSIKN